MRWRKVGSVNCFPHETNDSMTTMCTRFGMEIADGGLLDFLCFILLVASVSRGACCGT